MEGGTAYISISALAGLVAIALYVAYTAIRPKPLPGIPYNLSAANKLFGDVPEMMGYVLRTQRIFVSHTPPHSTLPTCPVVTAAPSRGLKI